MPRQLKAEKTATAGAAAALEPDDPTATFPTFAQEFFGGEPMIPSLLSAPLEPELQAQEVVAKSNNMRQKPTPALQPSPESEKMDVDMPLLLPAPGLPARCPVVSEKLTIAAGGHVYPLLPPSPFDSPWLSHSGYSNIERGYSHAEPLHSFKEEERWRKQRELSELTALIDQQIKERGKTDHC